jgi:exosortase family protein XrtF
VKNIITEFRPTIFFLLKFLGIFLIGNLLYGWFVTSWLPQADPLTVWASDQSAWVLNLVGSPVSVHEYAGKSHVYLQVNKKAILTVFEGCNGVNVVIVFFSFLLAFGPYTKSLIWFSLLGLFVIHLSNVARIVLLFFVTQHFPDQLFFVHKYLFTAFIYLFVFLLWIWWVIKFAKPKVA